MLWRLLITEILSDWFAFVSFAKPLNHRPGWPLRAVLSMVFMAACYSADALLLATDGPWHLMLSQVVILGMVFWCVDGAPTAALYVTVWISLAKSFALQSWNVIYYWLIGPVLPEEAAWVWYLYSVWALLLMTAIHYLLARRMPYEGRYSAGKLQTALALLILCFFDSFILTAQNWHYLPVNGNDDRLLLVLELYCMTFLYLIFLIARQSRLERELLTAQLLFRQQKEQYELSKENITLINHKCHDLKHQVAALRGMGDDAERSRYLDRIDASIGIYDSTIRTGSEVLDTILTQKSLLCAQEGIHVHCVADGARTDFMDPVDLYAIFGNLVDNAVEAVRKLGEGKERLIDVLIHVQQQFLVISVSNPAETVPRFEDGLPVTTKADGDYHGYGLPSVRRTIRQYGGHMTVEARADLFLVRILIPLP